MEKERSGPHRTVEKWLQEAGISYESEYKSFPPFSLDLYLPEWNLGIEVDGPYHLRHRDAERDTKLSCRYGVLVLHIKTAVMKKEATQRIIQEFIEQNAATVERRKQRMRTINCLLYTSPSPRDRQRSRMPSSA